MAFEGIKKEMKKLNLLFVDDEELVVETMQEVLPMFFKDSFFALNGKEGISISKNNKIDVVITDLSMPVMNGMDMIEKIRDENPAVKVVFISGHNEDTYKEKVKEIGGAFIVKPISSKDLFSAMQKVI